MSSSPRTDGRRLPSLHEKIMSKRKITPDYIAAHIRRVLKDGGSAPHSEEVQHFFKEEVQSRGWYTAELRKFAVRFRRSIARERGMDFVVQVADKLFSGRILEEKVLAVFLLEKQTKNFGENEFQLFATWLDRVTSWADHDALGALFASADGGRRPCPLPSGFPLGEVAESLAAARGVCGTDPGSARAAVF
jgi:DNA alkylation repair enzyme